MLARRVLPVVKAFQTPKVSIGDLNAEAAASLIEASSDVALIVDAEGVIRDMAFHSGDLCNEIAGCDQWLGQPLLDTVALDSRPKVEALLRDAHSSDQHLWRHINHAAARGGSVPILYCRGAGQRRRQGWSCSAAICARSPRSSSVWSMRSTPWSATTRACAMSRRGIGCCSRCPRRRC